MKKDSQTVSMRTQMPKVAEMVDQLRAEMGRQWVDACIRAAQAGQPDHFYAIEGGHVLGTPFTPESALGGDLARAFLLAGAAVGIRQPTKEPSHGQA